MQRNIETLTKVVYKYLERNSLRQENPLWEIRKSDLGDFGIFATRPIKVGEVIFKDAPVILGPRAALTCPLLCVNCFKKENLKPCEKECGLLLCSEKCQKSFSHQKECKVIRQWQKQPISGDLSGKLIKVLSPIRSLLLSDEDKEVVKYLKAHLSNQHGFEVDVMKKILHLDIKEDEEMFMRFVCSVMDANAFEVILGNEDNQSSVKGLYSLASLVNHCCTPNTTHVFDQDHHIIVKASKFIPKDAEIFHSYSRIIWGTPTRRFHLLRTKHFICKCQRCEDPTEFGSYVSAILCKICKKGRVIPIQPMINNGKWQCEDCGGIVSQRDVADVASLLGSALNSFTKGDFKYILRFIQDKLPTIVPENNETVVELKYKIIWTLGHQQEFTWADLPDDLIYIKQKYCKDLLTLLETLRLGKCKRRGLLLYELYCCLKELKRRHDKFGNFSNTKSQDHEMKNLLLEAADILTYDVDAPAEVKKMWPEALKKIEKKY